MYNKKKLSIGYKGVFVIQDHLSKNRHWDLRLEFPVDSLKDSLTPYYEKRVWNKSTEPKPKFPDKSGTVLRSWAVPKHKLPGEKPLLATETEDHDIHYLNFKGTIPEGNYGAGTVDIFDKGTFELVDLDYDKKYVVKFNGKKVKGYYVLVKTKPKQFLWIKVKDTSEYKKSNVKEHIIESVVKAARADLNPLRERRDYGKVTCTWSSLDGVNWIEQASSFIACPYCGTKNKIASIIDYPQKTLCPQLWDVAVSPPVIKKEIKNKILNNLFRVLSNNFKNYQEWITDVSIAGSSTTNLYNFETDVDVNVAVDFSIFRKYNSIVSRHISDDLELRNFIRDKVYILNGSKLAGDHPIKYFVIGKGKRLESDFVYDLIHDFWITPPVLVDSWFDPDSEFFDAKALAMKIVNQILPEILTARTHLIDLIRLQKANRDITRQEEIIEDDLDQLRILKEKIKSLRLIRFKSTNVKLLSYAFSKNWKFFNIVSKYLQKYGMKNPLKFLELLLTSEEKEILNKHKKVAVIKHCPKKDLTEDRPKSEQQWCLYDSKGERLLGRHPTKQKALDQERVIQIHKHIR
jgi:hypothetical protein